MAVIRHAVIGDCGRLAELGASTFREAFIEGFAIPYPAEDLADFLPIAYGVEAFAAMIDDPSTAVWLGELEGVAVAYATAGACNLPHLDARPEHGELKRLYVAAGRQGLGLGRMLFQAALEWLERDGPRPLWIGVWSGNLKAQRFYARNGFDKVGEYDFPVGRWRDREFILRRG